MTIDLNYTCGIVCSFSESLKCNQIVDSNQAVNDVTLRPEIKTFSMVFSTEELISILTTPENSDPSFWKQCTWSYFALVPRFCSVSFLPFNWLISQNLLVKKNKKGACFERAYAPYFSEEDQKKLGCISTAEKIYYIYNEPEFKQGEEILDDKIHSDVLQILTYFIKDSTSAALGLTYLNEKGEQTSRIWSKLTREEISELCKLYQKV